MSCTSGSHAWVSACATWCCHHCNWWQKQACLLIPFWAATLPDSHSPDTSGLFWGSHGSHYVWPQCPSASTWCMVAPSQGPPPRIHSALSCISPRRDLEHSLWHFFLLIPLSSNSEIKRIDRLTFILFAPYWNDKSRQLLSFVVHEIPILTELPLGHLCYHLTDLPPQSNSLPCNYLRANHMHAEHAHLIQEIRPEGPNFT